MCAVVWWWGGMSTTLTACHTPPQTLIAPHPNIHLMELPFAGPSQV